MIKNRYGLVVAFVSLLFAVGCAPRAYTPVDLNPKIASGQMVQKTDNFVVLYDKSSSMDESYVNAERKRQEMEKASTYGAEASTWPPAGPPYRLDVARDVTDRMIMTIPNIKLMSGLRNFGGDSGDAKANLIYGMTPLNKTDFIKAVDKTHWGYGRTPLGSAMAAAGEDLKPLPGRSALIIVSDFEELKGIDDIRSKSVLESVAMLKAQYGDRLCIYPVQIGFAGAPGGKTLTQKIVQDYGCGAAVNAEDLGTPAAMADFVEKIFLGPPPPAQATPMQEGAGKAEEAQAMAAAPAAKAEQVSVLENIHFDFDKSVLRPGDRAILKKHAAWLQEHKDYAVLIEGHCDERGTAEYNLALGERRAAEAKKYLKALGIGESRIKTISYGEERPADPGHNKEAWAKNRRCEFKLTENK